jgi:high-affinity nickel permease
MKFNPEINFGTIVEISVFIIALIGGIRKFGILEQKLNIMYSWWERTILGQESSDHPDTQKFFGKRP